MIQHLLDEDRERKKRTGEKQNLRGNMVRNKSGCDVHARGRGEEEFLLILLQQHSESTTTTTTGLSEICWGVQIVMSYSRPVCK